MRASHVIGIILIVVGVVGVVASLGGYGFGATLPWLVAIALIGVGLWAIVSAVAGRPAGAAPPPAPPRPAGPAPAASGGPATAPVFTAPPPAPPSPSAGAAGPWGAAPLAVHSKGVGNIELAGSTILGPTRCETFLGEIRLDLTQAVVPEGETSLSVSTILGEIKILAPADVGVAVRASTLLGATEVLGRKGGSVSADETAVTADYATAARRLRIDARTVLGDVAVRRARPHPWQPPAPVAPTAPVQPPVDPPAAGPLAADSPAAGPPEADQPPADSPPA